MKLGRLIREVARDLRHAGRTLSKAPGFAMSVILTFALGIGANAAIFSVVYGVLLRPLPYRDSDAVVLVQGRDRITGRVSPAGFSGPDLYDWQQRATVFESIALCSRTVFAVETTNGFETVAGALVSSEFFDITGAPMLIGLPASNPKAAEIVISARLWQQNFGSDQRVVGRQVRLNSQAYTIVGVVRNDFELPLETRRSLGATAARPHIWAPSELQGSITDRKQRSFYLVGRLKPGVSIAEARPVVEAVALSIASDFPATSQRWDPVVTTLSDEMTGAIRPVLWVFLGAVGLVLLVACANAANLLLARQSSKQREISIRMSLGASRRQLAVQQLSEVVVLSGLGGVLGFALAFGAVHVLLIIDPGILPRVESIRVDLPVALFALAAAAFAAFFAAAAPVAQMWTRRSDLLRPASVALSVSPATRHLRSGLVIAQLAVCLTLLVGAMLLSRSFLNLIQTDVGIASHSVVAVELNLAMGRTLPPARQMALTKELLERVGTIPGVSAAGAANALPPNRSRMVFEFPDPTASSQGVRRLNMVNPTPGYFATLGIPLLAGRLFSDADHASAAKVAILSASAARALFGEEDPIGKQLPGANNTPATVIGVVGDVKYGGLNADASETLYVPFDQYPFRNMTLVASTSGDPRRLATTIERAIHEVDREVTRGSARVLEDVLSEAAAQPRFRTALLTAIAGLALLLGAVGLYGVVSYAVSRRTVEIGVRMALGATDSRVMAMVLKEVLIIAAIGSVFGTVGAVALTRTIEAFLFEVAPTDGWSFALAVGTLLTVTLIAAFVPVRRASRINPVTALRSDY